MKERVTHVWHDDWIAENLKKFPSYIKAAEEYRREFNVDICSSAFKNHCRYKLGVSKTRLINYRHITKEQREWLKDIYPKVGVKEARIRWNEKYNDNVSVSCIKQIAKNACGVTVNRDVAIANRLKAAHGEASKRAIRKPGETRIECGRLVMKSEDGEWKSAGRCVWEKHYGKIPNGYALLALDGDTTNIDPANLEIIPWSYLGKLAKNNFFSSNPDITKAGIIWCDLENVLENDKKCMKG